jgi:hypothetical protein
MRIGARACQCQWPARSPLLGAAASIQVAAPNGPGRPGPGRLAIGGAPGRLGHFPSYSFSSLDSSTWCEPAARHCKGRSCAVNQGSSTGILQVAFKFPPRLPLLVKLTRAGLGPVRNLRCHRGGHAGFVLVGRSVTRAVRGPGPVGPPRHSPRASTLRAPRPAGAQAGGVPVPVTWRRLGLRAQSHPTSGFTLDRRPRA